MAVMPPPTMGEGAVVDTVCAAFATMPTCSQSCQTADALHNSRGALSPGDASLARSSMMRAQGRPGADRTHGPRAAKSTRQNHRYGPDHPAFPARWLYGLYVLSSGTGVLAPVVHDARQQASRTWPQQREARTTRLHRQRHVVRPRVKHTLRRVAAIAFPVQRS